VDAERPLIESDITTKFESACRRHHGYRPPRDLGKSTPVALCRKLIRKFWRWEEGDDPVFQQSLRPEEAVGFFYFQLLAPPDRRRGFTGNPAVLRSTNVPARGALGAGASS
jgi:hypothetical protein